MTKVLYLFLFHLKGRVYKEGFRPPLGSLLYSPSLALIYSLKDYQLTGYATELTSSPEYQEVSQAIQARTNPTGGSTIVMTLADFKTEEEGDIK